MTTTPEPDVRGKMQGGEKCQKKASAEAHSALGLRLSFRGSEHPPWGNETDGVTEFCGCVFWSTY